MSEALQCNADGIPHAPHEWDFGSPDTFWCAGYSGPCPACADKARREHEKKCKTARGESDE